MIMMAVPGFARSENPYCDERSGYGCAGYGYEPGYYPRDRDRYYGHRHHHRHHRRRWWY